MRPRRLVLVVAAIAGLVTLLAPHAQAHPLGNFSVNTYAGLVIRPDRVLVDYVVDMAEIPALQARQRIDADRNGHVDPREERRYRGGRCTELARGLGLRLGGRRVALAVEETALRFPPGVANLLTLRLECLLAAPAVVGDTLGLSFVDSNLRDRVGWREVTAIGEGTRLRGSSVPKESISNRLTSYPQDLLQSPLSVRRASLTASPAGDAATREPVQLARVARRADRMSQAFASLVERRELSIGFVLVALAIAASFGMLHAIAPGHGKTVMAAYLVGQRGVWREGLLLAGTVAVTHTVGVAGLGVLISLSDALAPEALYPSLGIASGLLFAAVGLGLLLRSRGGRGHHHHEHGGHRHGHTDADHVAPQARRPLGRRNLVTLGLAGGLVPSPSALIVLFAATALGRASFGIALVIAYGLGMAAILVGIGFLLVRARDQLERHLEGRVGAGLQRLAHAMPAVTASLVILGGLAVAVRAAGGL